MQREPTNVMCQSGAGLWTYLTSRVQQTFSLPTTHTEMVEIKIFGATEGIKHPCNVVDINIITRDGCTQRISALVVPHICDAIASPFGEASIRRYPHLASLDLADRLKPTSANIDILIGVDYYWSLVSGRVERGPSGPTAIEIRVGWVLSGPIESDSTDQTIVGFVDTHILRVDTQSDQLETLGIRVYGDKPNRGVSPHKVYSRK